jgi:hypothetical protein
MDMLVYFIAVWNILWMLGIFMAIWYILWSLVTYFSRFGLMYQKSGSPGLEIHLKRKLFDKNVLQTATPIRNQLKKIIRMIILKLFLHQNF